jgi:hypothetical protein
MGYCKNRANYLFYLKTQVGMDLALPQTMPTIYFIFIFELARILLDQESCQLFHMNT